MELLEHIIFNKTSTKPSHTFTYEKTKTSYIVTAWESYIQCQLLLFVKSCLSKQNGEIICEVTGLTLYSGVQ